MEYPEHEKLAKVKGDSQIIGSFLDTGIPEGVVFAKYDQHERLYPITCDIQEWLAAYFGINREKLEEEKVQMLEELRKREA
jgi:hypothetical protein